MKEVLEARAEEPQAFVAQIWDRQIRGVMPEGEEHGVRLSQGPPQPQRVAQADGAVRHGDEQQD